MWTQSAAWKRTLFCERLHMRVLDWTGHRLLVCTLTLTLQTYIMEGKASWCRSEWGGIRLHTDLQHGLEWADWFLIILQMVSGAVLTHRCLRIILAEMFVLPLQPHSIYLGKSTNWTPFAPYCPCRYLSSLLYLVVLEAAHISTIHAGNRSRRKDTAALQQLLL